MKALYINGCWFAALLLGLMIANALLGSLEAPETNNDLLEGARGFIVGQLGMVAIWTVLWPARLLGRLIGTVVVLYALFGSLATCELFNAGSLALVSLRDALFLPLGVLAPSVPLCVVRFAFGWRLIDVNAEQQAGNKGYTIVDICVLTTAVAIALVLATWGLPLGSHNGGDSRIAGMLIAWIVATVWSALMVPPVLILLGTRTPWRVVAALFAYAGLVIMAAGVLVHGSEGLQISLFTFQGGSMVPLVSSVLLARWLGYRLARRSVV